MARYDRISWTESDYSTARADILARINRQFPDFTRTSPADPEMAIFEMLAYLVDLIRYYEDSLALENFLITARERQSVILHCKALAYRLATATASQVHLVVTVLDGAQTSPITLFAGDPVTTDDGAVPFELVSTVEIPAGQTTAEVDAIQGQTVNEDLDPSDGTASQTWTLGQTPFLWDSETLAFDGDTWTRVDDFLLSGPSDNHYTVDVDASDAAIITTGDGTSGRIPPEGAQPVATYRIGGGTVGNVDAGTVTKLGNTYTTAAGKSVRLAVTNPLAADPPGTDRETEAHAKLYAPKSLAAGSRSVAASDYETNATQVAGCARALALTSNDDPTIDENTVMVFLVPPDASTAQQALLDAVKVQLTVTTPAPNTVKVRCVPAGYLDLSPVGTLWLRKQRTPPSIAVLSAIADAVLTQMRTWFSPTNIDVPSGNFTAAFGTRVAVSDFHRLITAASSLPCYLDLNSPAADITVSQRLFPRLRAATKVVGTDHVDLVWALVGSFLTIRSET